MDEPNAAYVDAYTLNNIITPPSQWTSDYQTLVKFSDKLAQIDRNDWKEMENLILKGPVYISYRE